MEAKNLGSKSLRSLNENSGNSGNSRSSKMKSSRMKKKKIKVVIAIPGLDSHWRGAMVVVKQLQKRGMEVVYLGNRFPEEIVNACIEEDPDVLGLSFHSDSYRRLMPEIIRGIKDNNLSPVIVVGGSIPRRDYSLLKEIGVHEVFGPGTAFENISRRIIELLEL